jgi:predicted nucleic acid-binding protein
VLGREAGVDAQLALLDEVAGGAYELVSFLDDDVAAAIAVIERYRDLGVDLADASIVVLAGRLGTERVLSLDERHFRAMTTPDGRAFVLLPADASMID